MRKADDKLLLYKTLLNDAQAMVSDTQDAGAVADVKSLQTPAPTAAPTEAPTDAPTVSPTDAPTWAPTETPTDAPTVSPTDAPTDAPTFHPCNDGSHGCDKTAGGICVQAGSGWRCECAAGFVCTAGCDDDHIGHTCVATVSPTDSPTVSPTTSPTETPTATPSDSPTDSPTVSPTDAPTATPTAAPTGLSTDFELVINPTSSEKDCSSMRRRAGLELTQAECEAWASDEGKTFGGESCRADWMPYCQVRASTWNSVCDGNVYYGCDGSNARSWNSDWWPTCSFRKVCKRAVPTLVGNAQMRLAEAKARASKDAVEPFGNTQVKQEVKQEVKQAKNNAVTFREGAGLGPLHPILASTCTFAVTNLAVSESDSDAI